MRDRFFFLNYIHPKYVEYLYEKYKKDPMSIDKSWYYFFYGFDFGKDNTLEENNHINKIEINDDKKYFYKKIIKKEIKIYDLIQSYKYKGHYIANINPIIKNNIKKKFFNISEKKIDNHFYIEEKLKIGKNSLKDIVKKLENIYCSSSIGLEYFHISDLNKIHWIEKWFQKNEEIKFSEEEKKMFLKKLNESVLFENFIHNKFIGQKRFSIEGNESLLPALEYLIAYSSEKYNTDQFIMGMSHRGRINILSNFFKKENSKIFSEFQEKKYKDKNMFSGDVKYHLGYQKKRKTFKGKNINLYLAPNPSHLESVYPVIEGITRSKMDLLYENEKNKKIIPIIIHGDASLSGQGIVYETLQLSKLKGYKTGGTIHIVINNQIGFTTYPSEGRSSFYCTDVAKTIESPILHVNSDDVESVIKSIFFSIDFRMNYNEDIFIDLVGYRKYGHNESDEPRFTNPILYKKISDHENCFNIYKKKLKQEKIIDEKYIRSIEDKYNFLLQEEYDKSKKIKWISINKFLKEEWKNFSFIHDEKEIFKKIDTRFPKKTLIEISKNIFLLPKKKKFLKKINILHKKRLEMIIKNSLVDWSMAELLSYSTLLYEGFNIRLSGEDVSRGTFCNRHIIIKTEEEEEIIQLNKIGKGKIQIYNSPLSEYGVLGFDYGYSMVNPYNLTIWEAQFGDFGNGAQIIIDQYISSGETKWKIHNGIVLYLPHGCEGQGPEHSSARIERYLQLCAKNNLFIVNCSSPSNFFHLLRRHMKFNFRKPLIIFTPKSLLRNPKCVSSIEDLSEGSFQEIIDDYSIKNPEKIKNIIFCSGKIYYELLNKRELKKNNNTALIRIEQIYPIKTSKIRKIISKYYNKKNILWVQEEPKNMGIWTFISKKIKNINLISPHDDSSPSSGSYANFIEKQNNILETAFSS